MSAAVLTATAASLPSWYPEDAESFTKFHGENLPAVADDGNAFTAEEEAALSKKAGELKEKYGYDIVIFTDINKTDVKNVDYAENYYIYNGYGTGDDFAGTLFFINTDPDNIRWWYEGFGRCSSYLTGFNENVIDELVQPYMSGDDYYKAADKFLDCLASVFKSGKVLPEWYPAVVENPFPDFHGENLPRVVDNADIFTDEEEAELTVMINELIEKYEKYDLVIFTDMSSYGIDTEDEEGVYPADFYQFNGYGIGDDYSGSVFYVCMNPVDRYWWSAARGKSEKFFTETNVNRLDDKIEPYMVDGKYFEAAKVYIETIGVLYEKGKIPNVFTAGDIVGITIVSSIIAAVVGGIRSGKALKTMKTVGQAAYANNYIVDNSLDIRDKKATFLYETVTKTYIPPSSSSSGGSSYRGGYHSSGGGHFSGGGRHF